MKFRYLLYSTPFHQTPVVVIGPDQDFGSVLTAPEQIQIDTPDFGTFLSEFHKLGPEDGVVIQATQNCPRRLAWAVRQSILRD